MKTEELVQSLASSAAPVKPVDAPGKRLLRWLGLGLPYALAVALVAGLRPDLWQKMTDPLWALEQAAAFVTAILAAYAALSLTIPGRSARIMWLPAPSLLVWLATLGAGCLRSWVRLGPEGLAFAPELECLPSIALVGLVPSLVIFLMVRKGAPLSPGPTLALAALAAASLGHVGHSLFHAQDASVMVLVWHFGSVAILSFVAGLMGRHALGWPRHDRVEIG